MIKKFILFNRKICIKLEEAFPKFFVGSKSYGKDLNNLILNSLNDLKPLRVLEVGGIDRPLLTKSDNYRYIGLDIDSNDNCYSIYDEFIIQSIEDDVNDAVELVISITLLEHVPNNKKSFRSMYKVLLDGGEMHHYVPSKNHPYSLILRLVGPKLQKVLINYLRPHAEEVTGYPAFFNLCTVSQMQKELSLIGFKNINITPYYKATDYFAFFVPAYLFVAILENLFEFTGQTWAASGMVISASK